ncbi:hypothetical protein [Nocardioides sp. Kera G14]|nr:hypothetical protein [Nocardioides sp. Kera G14]UDY24900.1 hypothetical protein LH076_06295 [Nocardioides sp. Kera G14]
MTAFLAWWTLITFALVAAGVAAVVVIAEPHRAQPVESDLRVLPDDQR